MDEHGLAVAPICSVARVLGHVGVDGEVVRLGPGEAEHLVCAESTECCPAAGGARDVGVDWSVDLRHHGSAFRTRELAAISRYLHWTRSSFSGRQATPEPSARVLLGTLNERPTEALVQAFATLVIAGSRPRLQVVHAVQSSGPRTPGSARLILRRERASGAEPGAPGPVRPASASAATARSSSPPGRGCERSGHWARRGGRSPRRRARRSSPECRRDRRPRD